MDLVLQLSEILTLPHLATYILLGVQVPDTQEPFFHLTTDTLKHVINHWGRICGIPFCALSEIQYVSSCFGAKIWNITLQPRSQIV